MRRKYKPGEKIFTFEDLLKQQYVIVNYGLTNEKTTHISVILSQTVRTVKGFLEKGFVREAIRLTNREFYGDLSVEDIYKKLSLNLCKYCSQKTTFPKCGNKQCEATAKQWLEEKVE